VLDDVPGLGPARRATLLKHFGSVRKLRAASVEEIAAVPRIGSKLAGAIAVALGSNTSSLGGPISPGRPLGEIPPDRPLGDQHEDR
jgi:excinuclease ABC subunit C